MRRLEWMGAEPADRCCNELPTAKNAADDKATSTTVIIEPVPLSSTASAARLLTHSARGTGLDDTPVPAFASVSHPITPNVCQPRRTAAATRPLPAELDLPADLNTERSHRRPFEYGQDHPSKQRPLTTRPQQPSEPQTRNSPDTPGFSPRCAGTVDSSGGP
jgi:hypothetical protein